MPCDWLGIEGLDDCEESDATEYFEYWELRFELEAVEAFHIKVSVGHVDDIIKRAFPIRIWTFPSILGSLIT